MLHKIRNIVKINKVIIIVKVLDTHITNPSPCYHSFYFIKLCPFCFPRNCVIQNHKKKNRVDCSRFQEHVLKQPPYCFLVFEAHEGRKLGGLRDIRDGR